MEKTTDEIITGYQSQILLCEKLEELELFSNSYRDFISKLGKIDDLINDHKVRLSQGYADQKLEFGLFNTKTWLCLSAFETCYYVAAHSPKKLWLYEQLGIVLYDIRHNHGYVYRGTISNRSINITQIFNTLKQQIVEA